MQVWGGGLSLSLTWLLEGACRCRAAARLASEHGTPNRGPPAPPLLSSSQDFPKSLPDSARVGFTVINQVGAAAAAACFSPPLPTSARLLFVCSALHRCASALKELTTCAAPHLRRLCRSTPPVLLQVWAAYSPVKNSPADAAAKAAAGNPSHSAASGELDQYETACRVREEERRMVGCSTSCRARVLVPH